jgi:phosphoribosylaminoimidazole-succinocarboxamide synthase
MLGDEISPDSCRLWDINTDNKLDKDRFRRDLGGIMEAYCEVAKRLGVFVEPNVIQQAKVHHLSAVQSNANPEKENES